MHIHVVGDFIMGCVYAAIAILELTVGRYLGTRKDPRVSVAGILTWTGVFITVVSIHWFGKAFGYIKWHGLSNGEEAIFSRANIGDVIRLEANAS